MGVGSVLINYTCMQFDNDNISKGRVTLWPILCPRLIWMKFMCKTPRHMPGYITSFLN